MVYAVTNWQDRGSFTPDLIERFERGSAIEELARRELRELGYSIKEERQPFEIRDYRGRLLARGIVDGFLVKNRDDYPFEIKSLHPNIFNRIHTMEDFDRYVFFRKYPRQLLTYMYQYNREQGFFLLDDCLGHWKPIPVRLDYEKMERVLKQLEEVAVHLENKTQPDFHPDPTVCTKCTWFKRVCTPPWSAGEGISVIEGVELEAMIRRREELDAAATEWGSIDKKLKETFKAMGIRDDRNYMIGDFLLTAKKYSRKAYDVKATEYFVYKIDSVKEPGKEEI
jgi:CRISPR/Cas system-associated exonuclease Cas4 (RecB family)